MAWGRCDDSFYDHPKVRRLPKRIRNEAAGLYWRAISMCNRHLTDGLVHAYDLDLLDARRVAVDALVDVGLWERVGSDYRVHDYTDYNKTADEVIEERSKRAAAGRAGGLASGRSRGKQQPSKDEASASQSVGPPLNPRPVPSSTQRESASLRSHSLGARASFDHVREGLPHLPPEAEEAILAAAGIHISTLSDSMLTHLDGLVERHGLEAMCTEMASARDRGARTPQQLVFRARDRLEPLHEERESEADVITRLAEQTEREAAEHRRKAAAGG